MNVQKHPPEAFCKNLCSCKFLKNYRKTSVPETLFKKRLWLQACNFIKKETLVQVFSCEFCEISKNTFYIQNTSERLLLNIGY